MSRMPFRNGAGTGGRGTLGHTADGAAAAASVTAGAAAAPSSLRRPGTDSLDVLGLDAPVEVRRHPTARRMTLRVSRSRRAVIVTLPRHCCLSEAGQFVGYHLDWVRARLKDVPEPVELACGVVVPLRGRMHRIRCTGDATAAGPTILVRLPVVPTSDAVIATATADLMPELVVHGRTTSAGRRLQAWLMEEARRDLAAAVTRYTDMLAVSASRVTLRDQASRWGSCASSGALSFSWRLIMAPPYVLDYVAAHEVTHLIEMNHGPRFWKLLRQAAPHTDEAKAWLQHHGADLHRYAARR